MITVNLMNKLFTIDGNTVDSYLIRDLNNLADHLIIKKTIALFL